MKTQKTGSDGPDTQSTCIDSVTIRDMRAYTYQIFDTVRDLDDGLFSVREACRSALRVSDRMKASSGRVPITDLAPFHEAIAASVRVITGAPTLLRDLRNDMRRLAGVLYKLPDPFKVNDEEAENN